MLQELHGLYNMINKERYKGWQWKTKLLKTWGVGNFNHGNSYDEETSCWNSDKKVVYCKPNHHFLLSCLNKIHVNVKIDRWHFIKLRHTYAEILFSVTAPYPWLYSCEQYILVVNVILWRNGKCSISFFWLFVDMGIIRVGIFFNLWQSNQILKWNWQPKFIARDCTWWCTLIKTYSISYIILGLKFRFPLY
jgi:hypothetical protein